MATVYEKIGPLYVAQATKSGYNMKIKGGAIMEQIEVLLSKTQLFQGLSKNEIEEMLPYFRGKVRLFAKDEILQWEQSSVDSIGILLSGSAVAYRSTASGHHVIMNYLHAASVFGDILAADPSRTSPVTIQTLEPCEALFIDYTRFVSGPVVQCSGYGRLMHNYIETISRRYFALQDRIACLIMPTLREKILYFLYEQSGDRKGEPFTIPFDRAAMADYLNADRSALSRELSTLKNEGILDYHKNTFKLL